MKRRNHGFTLIELLIATAIFALVGVMAYSALFSVLEARASTERAAERLAAVQFAVFRLTEDLRQTVDRPVRAQVPDERLPLFIPVDGERVLTLTRGGLPNPADQQRSSLVRVHWLLREGRLLRGLMVHPDTLPGQEARRRLLLDEVDAVELRFLGAGDEWHDRWPPLNAGPQSPGLPRAVELTLVLPDWGEVTRLVPLAGSGIAAAAGEG